MIVMAGLLVAGVAQAQDTAQIPRSDRLVTPLGAAITVGGGIVGFTDDATNDRTDLGGGWEVRAVYGTRSYIAVEGAYVGSARSLSNVRDTTLISNGAEAAVRFNLPMELGTEDMLIEPFAIAGIGASEYIITGTNDETVSGFVDGDGIVTVPLGIGIAGGYEGAWVDTRVVFRPSFDADTQFSDNNAFDSLAWTANVGAEF
jgi:hypothetical protein